MTEEQVSGLYPSAKKIHLVMPSHSITECFGGSYYGLEIPFDYGRFHFSAAPCFTASGKLDQVYLIAYPKLENEYVLMEEVLRNLFGKEIASGGGGDLIAWTTATFSNGTDTIVILNQTGDRLTITFHQSKR